MGEGVCWGGWFGGGGLLPGEQVFQKVTCPQWLKNTVPSEGISGCLETWQSFCALKPKGESAR